jgi:hypothetical protein
MGHSAGSGSKHGELSKGGAAAARERLGANAARRDAPHAAQGFGAPLLI